MDYTNIKSQMINFLQNETKKAGFDKVVVGISGGLDSAIVSVLCKEAFGDNMLGVLMPSQYSSNNSIEDAKKLCKKFNIKYEIISIAPMVEGYFKDKKATNLRIGNFSARMRMSVLYDISARDNALVVGTSNKSEILLGYGTIFGDIACAINPLGGMYKSDEYEYGKFLGVIDEILVKKPSADLWEGQSDEEELGYTYKELDNILKKLVDQGISKKELVAQGFNEKIINFCLYRIKTNKFKCELPKILTQIMY
jgi:NAD+ synthase